MSRALKKDDLLQLSKLYEAEFNQPDLHDRVLVFDVVASQLEVVSNVDENETSKAGSWYEDGDVKTTKISNEKTDMDAGNESAAGRQGNESAAGIDAKGDQQIEGTLSHEPQGDDIGKVAKHETAQHENKESLVIQEAKEIPETKQEIVVDDVEIHPKTGNDNQMEDQQKSEIPTDVNDANPSCLNDKDQNEDGNKIFSEGNEATSFPVSEEQVIRQHKFYIHSSWLAVQSSYFRSLFYSGMKESNAKVVHIQTLASEEQAHLMLLEAMYKIDVIDKANVDKLLNVLKLADKYDVQFVFKKCKYCLLAMVNSLEICETIMHFIKVENTITDVEDIASTIQSYLVKEFSPLDKMCRTTSFEELCEASVRYLLSSNELVTASENTVFLALMHWINKQGIENVLKSEGMPSILSVVRFELIPIDYLYNIVQHHSIARKFPGFIDHYLRGISYHALSDNMKKKLLCQPVKRKPSTELLLGHTCVIPRNKLDNLIGTNKRLLSGKFWFSGYEMALIITNVVKAQNSRGNQELFTARLLLLISNSIQHSEVSIQWQAESESFIQKPSEQFHTFDKDKRLTSVVVKYKMEKQPQALSNNICTKNIDEPGISFSAKEPTFSNGTTQQVKPVYFGSDGIPAVSTCNSSPTPPIPCLSIDVKMKLT